MELRKREIVDEQEEAHHALLHQAKRMTKASDTRFPEPDMGATVRLHIPDADSSKIHVHHFDYNTDHDFELNVTKLTE